MIEVPQIQILTFSSNEVTHPSQRALDQAERTAHFLFLHLTAGVSYKFICVKIHPGAVLEISQIAI